MNKSFLALTLIAAIGSFAPAAHAGLLCEDDDGEIEICTKRIPYTSLLRRAIPGVPSGVGRLRDDDDDDDAPALVRRAIPKAVGGDVPVIEKSARVPGIARMCKKYFPAIGETLPIPCDDE